MRLYRDRPDILTRGRWHFCQPGAKVIPYFHAFGSFVWDWQRPYLSPPLGEIPPSQGYSKGNRNKRLTGNHFCGDQSAWEQGILYADRTKLAVDSQGVPLCCAPLPQRPGGLVFGGGGLCPAGSASGGLVFGGSGFSEPECLATEADDDIDLEDGSDCLGTE
jgi:hypothetical protein